MDISILNTFIMEALRFVFFLNTHDVKIIQEKEQLLKICSRRQRKEEEGRRSRRGCLSRTYIRVYDVVLLRTGHGLDEVRLGQVRIRLHIHDSMFNREAEKI